MRRLAVLLVALLALAGCRGGAGGSGGSGGGTPTTPPGAGAQHQLDDMESTLDSIESELNGG